jgi:formate C-acetyltransferase
MVKAALEAYGFIPDPKVLLARSSVRQPEAVVEGDLTTAMAQCVWPSPLSIFSSSIRPWHAPFDMQVEELYTKIRKTHNQGVFDAYTPEMRAARKSGILTGLPDGYGRGRIIGDYRRVPLYGVDALIKAKQTDLKANLLGVMDEEKIRLREEVTEQVRALGELKEMAASYGYDIGKPAKNAHEAVQWLYFAYLAAVKDQVGTDVGSCWWGQGGMELLAVHACC